MKAVVELVVQFVCSVADANAAEVLDTDCGSNVCRRLRRGVLLERNEHCEVRDFRAAQ